MNQFNFKAQTAGNLPPNRTPTRDESAFTLIEMLTVIAIIGILAALILGGAGIATAKGRRARAEAERDALITAIENYKKARGYYPPDNTLTNTVSYTSLNSLYYELTGNYTDGNGNFFTNVNQEQLSSMQLSNVFGVTGLLNSSQDTNQPAVNFFGAAGKSTRTAHFFINGTSGATFTLFGFAAGRPTHVVTNSQTVLPFVQASGPPITVWNYVVTNPTNNPTEFDLWIDISWSGRTNRVCNWSRDPIPL